MRNEQHIHERYPDLFAGQADSTMIDLIQDLEHLYTASEPPARLLLLADMPQAAPPKQGKTLLPTILARQKFRPGRKFSRRVAVVAALAAVFVLLVGASYGTIQSLLVYVLNMEPGTQQVLQDNMYTKISQAQHVGGFTITLERAYADANRVIVGYTITKPKPPVSHTYNSTALQGAVLSTSQGLVLQGRGGSGYGGGQGNDATADSFDAASITGNPSQLQLHFAAQGLSINDFDGKTIHSYLLPGAVSFNFTVPFHAGRIVNPRSSVTAHGVTVTVERIVVTLSETRIYLRCPASCFVDHLSGDGWDSQSGFRGPEMQWHTPDGLIVSSFWDSFYNKHGVWTIHVMADPNSSLAGNGPWVFHIALP